MKIAISTDGDAVSAHFGRCPSFTILALENGKIVERKTLDNPGHEPGFLPGFLHEQGAECIIAGGAGPRAITLFEEKGMQVILGISGAIEDVISQIESGELKGGESLCQPGGGKEYGLDKSTCNHEQENN